MQLQTFSLFKYDCLASYLVLSSFTFSVGLFWLHNFLAIWVRHLGFTSGYVNTRLFLFSTLIWWLRPEFRKAASPYWFFGAIPFLYILFFIFYKNMGFLISFCFFRFFASSTFFFAIAVNVFQNGFHWCVWCLPELRSFITFLRSTAQVLSYNILLKMMHMKWLSTKGFKDYLTQ